MSTLKTNTIKNTDDVEMYLAKAWVNFNGQGTVAIRAAGNVSSITDNSTGDYTVNFANAMTDANYVLNTTAADLTWGSVSEIKSLSTTNATIRFSLNNLGYGDPAIVCVSIHR